jgi:aminopeptidase N
MIPRNQPTEGVCAGPAENLTRVEAEERAALLSVTSYEVTLDLTAGPTTFASTTVVRFRASDGTQTFLELIAPSVCEITLNGRTMDPARVFADSGPVRREQCAQASNLSSP